ncbi:hypothetical protein KNV09_gp147 [Vibrio phage Athena]|uniref:Uncharacterized protein n=3 Tax=Thalassavirus TaxID=2948922 RepID=A0A6M9Z2I2_9CAUD|nr:hypothetical protein KNV06_gp143 [Vibrio phage AG74]YP_010108763.1 hypothetical protein KNV09_gp147 [Vibrio phage Athena]YP_010114316.1 hypothetical protein KNV71_gp150 [Vibrio phage Gary]QIG66456.1 hypothetical protein CHAZLY21_165 [Vibrio phage Chazly21]QQO89781.1 hypothetical protein GRLPWR_167 [Vibrio phage GRLPWR]WBF69513.1 hypothetical protein IW18_164 [Vibrio phage IW18]QKN85000.1 hypothetical protein AG74_164 [Vibrio phage AG74]QKN85782.1 hypothetical protein ATHENA_164 [Vibrio ph
MNKFVLTAITASLLSAQAFAGWGTDTAATIEANGVNRQQKQYAKVQPVPFYQWSLERDLVIQLYNTRNLKAATHVVWRGDTSVIEGDCPAIGYGIPYDTSLTNPQTATDEDNYGGRNNALSSIGQAEPNGVYASTNTSATWVMCVNEQGLIEPVYVEAKVTGYPYPVNVDYNTNRVTKAGRASVTLRVK